MNTKNNPIEALCLGLKDGGCKFASYYPGSGSHEFVSRLEQDSKFMSSNERVAFEQAYGASLAGKRSVVCFKNVGLNVASDPFLHAVLNGVNAGLVVILIDDIEAQSSPERQDSRSFRDFFGGLWVEPVTIQMAYDFGYNIFDWSERFDIPVVIRITNQFYNLEGVMQKRRPKKKSKALSNCRDKYISYWLPRYKKLLNKNIKIEKWVEELYIGTTKYNDWNGIIVIGNCQREINKDKVDASNVLRIFTYPMPTKIIKDHLKRKKIIKIYEQGTSYANKLISNFINEVRLENNTGDILDLSSEWIVWNNLEKMFYGLKNSKPAFVVGDEGQFTDESSAVIQVCLCMGSSVGITMGLAMNGVDFPFCIVGDASFLHAGFQAFLEAKARGINFGLVLIDNGGAMSTGGQLLPVDILGLIRDDICISVEYNKTNKNKFLNIFNKMKLAKKLTILHVKI